jgi:hypothetical protein
MDRHMKDAINHARALLNAEQARLRPVQLTAPDMVHPPLG